jgi:hypothetical protein
LSNVTILVGEQKYVELGNNLEKVYDDNHDLDGFLYIQYMST